MCVYYTMYTYTHTYTCTHTHTHIYMSVCMCVNVSFITYFKYIVNCISMNISIFIINLHYNV